MTTLPTCPNWGDPSTVTDADAIRGLWLRLSAVIALGLPMPSYLRISADPRYADLTFAQAEHLRAWARALGGPEASTYSYTYAQDGITYRRTVASLTVPLDAGATLYLDHLLTEPVADAQAVDDAQASDDVPEVAGQPGNGRPTGGGPGSRPGCSNRPPPAGTRNGPGRANIRCRCSRNPGRAYPSGAATPPAVPKPAGYPSRRA